MKPITDLDGHTVRQARKQMPRDEEIKRLNEKIEFLSRTNMLYSDWEHRETQVTSDLIRKGIEEGKINAELRAEIERLKQRPWVGLTDEEIWSVVSRIGTADSDVNPYITIKDARAIEKLLNKSDLFAIGSSQM